MPINMVTPLLFLAVVFLLVFTQNVTVESAESLYNNRNYDSLLSVLESLNQAQNLTSRQRSIVHRLQGYLCLWGQDKDQNVDLPCAWREFVESSRLGDAAAYFYVGFLLSNHLYSDLSLLPSWNTIWETEKPEIVLRKTQAIAATCYYISAVGGYVPAIVAMANYRLNSGKDCVAAANYYMKAAARLPLYNSTVYTGNARTKYILTVTDPYRDVEEEIDPEYALSTIKSIPLRADKLSIFVVVALHLFHTQRYRESMDILTQILTIQPKHTVANYFLGLIYMRGLGMEQQEPTMALHHLEIAAESTAEAYNALGVMYFEGVGLHNNSVVATEYFKRAALNGSSYGALNAFNALANEGRGLDEESLTYLLQSAKRGNVRAQHMVGTLKLLDNKTCEAVSYLKKAVEALLWEKFYGDIHAEYVAKRHKVALLKYMEMAELGNPVAQVNAGNLLDEHSFFGDSAWLRRLDPSFNLDKQLAFKFYKLAERQNEDVVYRRLAEYYYYGLAPEPSRELYFFYLTQVLVAKNSLSQLARVAYDIGVMCQFGLGDDINCDFTREAYNLSRSIHPSGYTPSTIMMGLLDLYNTSKESLWKRLWSPSMIPYVLIVVWLIISLLFIYKRRI